ncbi:fibrillarin-like rRNA/tRNA 2'-O-methyltransferase [Candidatus Woesearchaeota archaeon]|nr:fibrillarin-like rRNA/tRNA 2'-O-methyltransferase [Candidatus Woesearchaeota archaeon]
MLQRIKKFPVFERRHDRRLLFTKNLTPKRSFFAEALLKDKGEEYRAWDVSRSKLGAAIKKGASQIGIKEGDTVLYLGASHGFTPSYVSDMVGKDGFVFCLDFAPRVVRDLVFVCEERENMAPILGDAAHPEAYKDLIPEEVDVVFQDIAQRNQVEIFLKNCDAYLKSGGFGLLALKARSVDVSKNPKQIFAHVRRELESHKGLTVVDYRDLYPFEKDHAMFICKKK